MSLLLQILFRQRDIEILFHNPHKLFFLYTNDENISNRNS